jgi:hypothetical protein
MTNDGTKLEQRMAHEGQKLSLEGIALQRRMVQFNIEGLRHSELAAISARGAQVVAEDMARTTRVNVQLALVRTRSSIKTIMIMCSDDHCHYNGSGVLLFRSGDFRLRTNAADFLGHSYRFGTRSALADLEPACSGSRQGSFRSTFAHAVG